MRLMSAPRNRCAVASSPAVSPAATHSPAVGYGTGTEEQLPGLRNQQRLARFAHGRELDDRLGPQRPAVAAWTGSSPFSIMTLRLRSRC